MGPVAVGLRLSGHPRHHAHRRYQRQSGRVAERKLRRETRRTYRPAANQPARYRCVRFLLLLDRRRRRQSAPQPRRPKAHAAGRHGQHAAAQTRSLARHEPFRKRNPARPRDHAPQWYRPARLACAAALAAHQRRWRRRDQPAHHRARSHLGDHPLVARRQRRLALGGTQGRPLARLRDERHRLGELGIRRRNDADGLVR